MNFISTGDFEAGKPVISAGSAPGGLSEFFRYHGFWSPGVRLFRAISFRVKAIIIALVFLLPITLLGWKYFSSQADQIRFTSKEQVGVAYSDRVMDLLPLLQHRRQLVMQGFSGAGDPAALSEVTAEVKAKTAALAAYQQQAGGDLGTTKAYDAFVVAGDAVPAAESKGATEAFEAHSAYVHSLLELLAASTDGSNLTLDPEIDTYYLLDMAMARLPVMMEAAAQLRARGRSVLQAGSATPAQSREIIKHYDLLRSEEAAAVVDLTRAIGYNAGVGAAIDNKAALLATTALLDEVDKVVLAGGRADAATSHVALATQAIEAMDKLQGQASAKLDALLAARLEHLRRDRDAEAVMLLAFLLIALYLFIAFGRVLGGGMKEITLHIDAMREGDLTTQPRAWGADEPAQVMLTLQAMQQAQRRMVGQMRASSDAIVDASTEIASGTGDLSRRTEISAANLEETAASMEQIAATVKGNEQAVEEATKLALGNARTAEEGGVVIGRVVQTMEAISEASGRIGDIVGSIDAIAFQTNILALNAAVEAARAGEQGRGFAVVASEVRALAQSVASSAREIKGLIGTNLEQVNAGVQVVQQAGATIGELVGGSKRIRELLDEVAAGARELSIGVNQTTSAVQQLDSVTQENAALVGESAASIEELKGQAERLAAEVARFRVSADEAPRQTG